MNSVRWKVGWMKTGPWTIPTAIFQPYKARSSKGSQIGRIRRMGPLLKAMTPNIVMKLKWCIILWLWLRRNVSRVSSLRHSVKRWNSMQGRSESCRLMWRILSGLMSSSFPQRLIMRLCLCRSIKPDWPSNINNQHQLNKWLQTSPKM